MEKNKIKVDAEDEERDEEMEAYEHNYNFRFEEPTNTQYLTTHKREVEESMRRKDDTRKKARESKKERKEDERRKKDEELVRYKLMKKEEIMDKLRKAEFVGGFKKVGDKKVLEKAEKELKTDFIPELYDKNMSKVFGDKYYDISDDNGLED